MAMPMVVFMTMIVTTSMGMAALRPRPSPLAASLRNTAIHTVHQTHVFFRDATCSCGRARGRRGSIEIARDDIAPMNMRHVEAELGLDGSAVDAIRMETLAYLARQLHILLRVRIRHGEFDQDVQRGYNLRVRELPDVDVVAALNVIEFLDIGLDMADFDVLGSCAG